ncbi:CDGSH iron-sulfur domain-containing protein [Cupriavidus malaysiensis]
MKGNLELVGASGRLIDRMEEAWLCRCGHSGNKPFCDGTHKRIGFRT